jgi:DnaJ-class molecular chaperone
MDNKTKEEKSYYEILGVSKSANVEEIRKAYKKLAVKYHPDKQSDKSPDANKKFQEISQAYQVLTNEDDRELYDQYGPDFKQHKQQHYQQNIPTISANVIVALRDLYHGKKLQLGIPIQSSCNQCRGKGTADKKNPPKCNGCSGRGTNLKIKQIGPGMIQQLMEKCHQCQGSGNLIDEKNKCAQCRGRKIIDSINTIDVDIEPGMMFGQRIIVEQKGHSLLYQVPGNVCITLDEKKNDNKMERDNDLPCNLLMTKEISLFDSLQGHTFSFRHFRDDELVNCSLPRNRIFANGESIILRGLGMPVWKKPGMFGDLVITFKVLMPTNIDKLRSPTSIKLLRRLFVDDESGVSEESKIFDTSDVAEGIFLENEKEWRNEKLLLMKQDDDDNNNNGQQQQCRQM